jgi:3-methyladenine DNA glycosylase AlkC
MGDVPAVVLKKLAVGEIETVNLMEWLAADMSALARTVARSLPIRSSIRSELLDASEKMVGAGVTDRLRVGGRAIAAGAGAASAEFRLLATHNSDLVRQWACYAVNDSLLGLSVSERLDATLPFAADRNMSVRETAWMAFRPHLATEFETVLPMLTDLAADSDENIRRFAVEVTRPRSVWGAHLAALKREPGLAVELLEQVKADSSRYVKLATGNWLNDASKSQPDWVLATCERWSAGGDQHTRFIVRRGLRTISKQQKETASTELPLVANDVAELSLMEKAS